MLIVAVDLIERRRYDYCIVSCSEWNPSVVVARRLRALVYKGELVPAWKNFV